MRLEWFYYIVVRTRVDAAFAQRQRHILRRIAEHAPQRERDEAVVSSAVGPLPAIQQFGDALRRMAGAATYLYQDGPHYWYSTQPTVTKLADGSITFNGVKDGTSVGVFVDDGTFTTLEARHAGGDDFTITPGCDKTKATCIVTFDNVVNFRGFSFVPGQDNVLKVGGQ